MELGIYIEVQLESPLHTPLNPLPACMPLPRRLVRRPSCAFCACVCVGLGGVCLGFTISAAKAPCQCLFIFRMSLICAACVGTRVTGACGRKRITDSTQHPFFTRAFTDTHIHVHTHTRAHACTHALPAHDCPHTRSPAPTRMCPCAGVGCLAGWRALCRLRLPARPAGRGCAYGALSVCGA